MINAFFYKYVRVLRCNAADSVAMFIRPLLSAILLLIFSYSLHSSSAAPSFFIVSALVANIISNAIIGAAYEGRTDLTDERLTLVELAPGGLRLYCWIQAVTQFMIASCQSLVVGLVLSIFTSVHFSINATAILSWTLLFAITVGAGASGVCYALTHGSFVAVSFTVGILLSFSGVFYPVALLPSWAQLVSQVSSLTPLIAGIRGEMLAAVSGTAFIYPFLTAAFLILLSSRRDATRSHTTPRHS